jgi:hypothetical protein
MAATRYDLLMLWNDLEKLFNTFNAENTTPASSQEDADAYALAHKAIQEMIKDGRDSQAMAMYYPYAKAQLGLKAKNALATNFGPEETPPIQGVRSLAFLRDVILPHIQNAKKVEYDTIFTYLCSFVGIDIEAERVRAADLAEHYKRLIAKAELADDAPNKLVGDQFRLFRSGSAGSLSQVTFEAATATATATAAANLF